MKITNNSSTAHSNTNSNVISHPSNNIIFPNTIFAVIIQKVSIDDPKLSTLIKLSLVCRRWALQLVPYHFRILKHSNFDEILKLSTNTIMPGGRECKFTDIHLIRPSKSTSLSSLQLSQLKQHNPNSITNSISSNNASQLIQNQYISQLVNGKLLKFLTTCTTIKSLSISHICLDYEMNFGNVIADIIKNPNIQLTKLELMGLDLVSNGASYIIQALKVNTYITELNLSRNFLREKDGLVIGDTIKHNQTLQKLDVSFNDFRISGLKGIIESLQYNTSLVSINLEAVCRLDCMITGINLSSPPLTPSSGSFVNPTIFTSNAPSFNIVNTPLSNIGHSLLNNNSPFSSTPPPPFFQLSGSDFYFNSNHIPSSPSSISMNSRLVESMRNLRLNTTLKSINLTHNTFGKLFNQSLSDLIQENSSLEVVTLNYLKLDDESGSKLAQSLRNNRSIHSISLIYNQLGKESGFELANSLSFNRFITHLNLSNNLLSEEVGIEFATMLKVNSTLTYLDLSDNNLGSMGAKYIFDALKSSNNSLKRMNLKNNKISDTCGSSIATFIKDNKSLTVLDLSNNSLQTNSGMGIAMALESNKTLESVYISYNQLLETSSNSDSNIKRCIQCIQNIFSKNHTLLTFDIDVGNHAPESLTISVKGYLERNRIHNSIFNQPSSFLVQKKKKKSIFQNLISK